MLGDLISAGVSLIAGNKQAKATAAANRQSRKFAQRERRIQAKALRVAARSEARRQDRWASKNIRLQKEFAQNGIRWKVADARRAGVHPLYALGANPSAYSPVSVGGVSSGGAAAASWNPAIDTGEANALQSAGQNIGRAVGAMLPQQERIANALSLTNMGLQNELLMAQIAQTRAGTGPGLPPLTSTRAFGYDIKPHEAFSDAETFQARYGEPAEWVMALPIAGADIMKNFYGPWMQDLEKWKRNLPRDQFRYHVVR